MGKQKVEGPWGEGQEARNSLSSLRVSGVESNDKSLKGWESILDIGKEVSKEGNKGGSVKKMQRFHDTWIGRIKECILTVSYSLTMNDKSSGFFKPTRELHQGILYVLTYLSYVWISLPMDYMANPSMPNLKYKLY